VRFDDVSSLGEPAEFAHHSAFGSCDGAAIELIQPVRLVPERVERGFAMARPGLQHVAYVVPAAEVADLRSALDARGMPEYLRSRLGDLEATLHDASAVLGHSLEIHAESEALRGFFGMGLEAGEGWDGSEPLRPIS
jgi:methylmalonyl-CoA/ethylmalonyl-CoA epimerase